MKSFSPIIVDAKGNYPSHYLPKHDLESVIYVMAHIWGYQLPWDEDLIGMNLTDLEDYFDFKSKVTDQDIIDLLPSFLIKAFKYISRLPDDKAPNYEKLKWCLHATDESPLAIDRVNGHARMTNQKLCPIKLIKLVSVEDDWEEGEYTRTAAPDDSCHALDLDSYIIVAPGKWEANISHPVNVHLSMLF